MPKQTTAGDWIETGPNGLKFETKLVHSGVSPDPTTGAILTPLIQSTTFIQPSIEEYLSKGYSYSRSRNPTVTAFEQRVASLENAIDAAAFGTGMAATTTVISAFMKEGDHCVITNCSYGGTNRIMREYFKPLGMTFDFVDFTDLSAIEKAIIPGKTKIVFSETPTNPTLKLVDISAVSEIAHKHGAIHVCDSTFATPVICRPLDFGADVTLQSTTKFYDGHNMTTGGALASKDQKIVDRIKFVQNMHGNIMSPQVAFLQLQTSKTMQLRVQKQSTNALTIAKFLEAHPKVTKVLYPALDSFPQRELAKKYHLNDEYHGGMLWFDVVGGSDAGRRLMNSIQRPWSLCENLGATESIITACAVMTHANMLVEDRLAVGVTDGFIRVSCGIEDVEDLIQSLSESLDQL